MFGIGSEQLAQLTVVQPGSVVEASIPVQGKRHDQLGLRWQQGAWLAVDGELPEHADPQARRAARTGKRLGGQGTWAGWHRSGRHRAGWHRPGWYWAGWYWAGWYWAGWYWDRRRKWRGRGLRHTPSGPSWRA